MSFKNLKFAAPILFAPFLQACGEEPRVEVAAKEAYCELAQSGPTDFHIITTNPKAPSEILYEVRAAYVLATDDYRGRAQRNSTISDGNREWMPDFKASLNSKTCELDFYVNGSSEVRVYELING